MSHLADLSIPKKIMLLGIELNNNQHQRVLNYMRFNKLCSITREEINKILSIKERH